jgi:putative tryptophan/tyrosine transport system substrate-binding protein
MDRRTFITGMTGGLLAMPLAAEAQPAGKVYRLGVLSLGTASTPYQQAFREGLRELGYVEGQNLLVEFRGADGREAKLTELAAEVVRLKPDALLATGSAATAAARKATTSIPIVAVTGDPVGSRFVASLAHPGGNTTGLAILAPDMSTKWVELVRELVPRASRVAVLAEGQTGAGQLRAMEPAARRLGLQLLVHDVGALEDIEPAFKAAVRERADAVVPLSSPLFFEHRRIVELAARHRLPAVYEHRQFTEAGGLVSYGPNISIIYRRAAVYVDKILKGAKPADLPVEQASKFELVINLKTAKALGLTIPPSLLRRADEVIQ